MKIRLLVPFVLGAVVFVSCKKDDDKDDTPQTSQPSSPQVEIAGTDAAMIAISTGTQVEAPFIGTITQFVGTAVANFDNSDAGMVTCEGEELSLNNGSYIFTPGGTVATIDFGSSVAWAVAGKGSVPPINYTYSRAVPQIGALDAESSVSTASDLTFGIDYTNSFTAAGSADSVLYYVHGPGGSIHKTVAASVRTVTFTKSEMSAVGTGAGYLQAAAYNYTVQNYNGYKVAFVNEGVFTKGVTLE
ncbi:MAG: hypothetical protein CMI36_12265 [Owenweeksia sp.]|nr:hypothetical protein [Owenweeksia sp.]MBF99758.1 hypothetical protein [Owenweeksia sp.]|tara:strand:+ start:7554 stop:8288 length:735 start_codon:yes stop_codon:yes gene_type:complete